MRDARARRRWRWPAARVRPVRRSAATPARSALAAWTRRRRGLRRRADGVAAHAHGRVWQVAGAGARAIRRAAAGGRVRRRQRARAAVLRAPAGQLRSQHRVPDGLPGAWLRPAAAADPGPDQGVPDGDRVGRRRDPDRDGGGPVQQGRVQQRHVQQRAGRGRRQPVPLLLRRRRRQPVARLRGVRLLRSAAQADRGRLLRRCHAPVLRRLLQRRLDGAPARLPVSRRVARPGQRHRRPAAGDQATAPRPASTSRSPRS